MQWNRSFATALAWGVFSTSWYPNSAFCPVKISLRQQQGRAAAIQRSVGSLGWDNEDFLESLSKGSDAIQKANDDYRALSRFRDFNTDDERSDTNEPPPQAPDSPSANAPLAAAETSGAVLTDKMKQQVKASHEGEVSQGGKLFCKMLARAQGAGGWVNVPPAVVPPPPGPAHSPYAAPMSPQSPQQFAAPNSLTVEQQAELYRQMLLQNAAPWMQYTVTAATLTFKDIIHKHVGINKEYNLIPNVNVDICSIADI